MLPTVPRVTIPRIPTFTPTVPTGQNQNPIFPTLTNYDHILRPMGPNPPNFNPMAINPRIIDQYIVVYDNGVEIKGYPLTETERVILRYALAMRDARVTTMFLPYILTEENNEMINIYGSIDQFGEEHLGYITPGVTTDFVKRDMFPHMEPAEDGGFLLYDRQGLPVEEWPVKKVEKEKWMGNIPINPPVRTTVQLTTPGPIIPDRTQYEQGYKQGYDEGYKRGYEDGYGGHHVGNIVAPVQTPVVRPVQTLVPRPMLPPVQTPVVRPVQVPIPRPMLPQVQTPVLPRVQTPVVLPQVYYPRK